MVEVTYISFSDDRYQYACVVDGDRKNHFPLPHGASISFPDLNITEVNFKKLKITYRHWKNRWAR